MYRRCMKSSEKVRFVRNTFQGALFLHLYLTDLLQMRGRRMSCTSKCEFRSKYAEIFLNCGVRKQEMAFSKAQTQAIMHKDGPMMVLAGPGSGKTTVTPSGPVSDEGVRNRSGGYSCDYLYPGSSRGDAGAV